MRHDAFRLESRCGSSLECGKLEGVEFASALSRNDRCPIADLSWKWVARRDHTHTERDKITGRNIAREIVDSLRNH
jgi:hypothetical protein